MNKISKEVAVIELDRFMETFRLDSIKKEKLKETIDLCVRFISEGMLIVTDDGHLEYLLLDPIIDDSGKELYDKLVIKNRRIKVEDLEKLNTGTDIDKTKKLISIMANIAPSFVSKISADDLMYFSEISAFFLPAK